MAGEDLVPLLPPSAYPAVTVGDTPYGTLTLAVRSAGLGKVRLVGSFAHAELTGTSAVLVTNRVDWKAPRLITRYLHRWPSETFYPDGQTSLGLDTERMRKAAASGKPWGLGFVAYSFLPLACLPLSPTNRNSPSWCRLTLVRVEQTR